MARPKSSLASLDIAAELERLEEQRRALIERYRAAEAAENTRRGEVILELLRGPSGAELAAALTPFLPAAHRPLFQASASGERKAPPDDRPAATDVPAPSRPPAVEPVVGAST